MAFKVDNAADAYAAITVLVVGADGVGTLEERKFLFDELGEVDVFGGLDAESLGGLLGKVVDRMYTELSDDGVALSADAVTEICAGARDVLDERQCHELLSLAARVAFSDGLESEERALLKQISDGLAIDAAAAQAMIARATT